MSGEAERDEGMARVAENNRAWTDNARYIIMAWLRGANHEFMSEAFRELPGIGMPNHPNAWGALSGWLVRKNLIIHTGEWRKSRSRRNHAHHYPVYRKGEGNAE